MESQIHRLEQEAYSSVLRAFNAQSDVISWEKVALMTELRKELKISDDEQKELLGQINGDDTIQRIRELRQGGRLQMGFLSTCQPLQDAISNPIVSASHKKQKKPHLTPPTSAGKPSLAFHQQAAAPSLQPFSSAEKRGVVSASNGNTFKPSQTMPGVASVKPSQYASTNPKRKIQAPNRSTPDALVADEPIESGTRDQYVGRKVWMRWPEDNNFYEAVITNYNPADGRHALVYNINTADEEWEWVNLNEISPNDIRWGGADASISRQTGPGELGHCMKDSIGPSGANLHVGRGQEFLKNQTKKGLVSSMDGIRNKHFDDIKILDTETLLREINRVFGASHPDPVEIEKGKKILKEHEQALINAIAILAEESNADIKGQEPVTNERSRVQKRGWKH